MKSNKPNDVDFSRDTDGFNARFKDVTLLSILIAVEFIAFDSGRFRDNVYGALYNQYMSATFCNGNCDSVKKQVVWLSTMQGFYSSSNSVQWITEHYQDKKADGVDLKNGLYSGKQGWTWGLYMVNSGLDIHSESYEYVDRLPHLQGNYAGSVIFTAQQNLQCGFDCKGW